MAYCMKTAYFSPSHKDRAFTLIEVLAAVSIMAFLILGVFSITTNVLNSWTRSNDQLVSNYEARVALDLIAQDLEAAVIRRNGQNWIEVNYNTPDPASFYSSLDLRPARLYFFSPVLTRPQGAGDICAVFYSLAYRNPFKAGTPDPYDANVVSGLYRIVVDPVNTFNVVLSKASEKGADNNYPLLSVLWGNGFPTQNEEGSASRTVNDSPDGFSAEDFLSANIIDFRVSVIYRKKNASGKYDVLMHPEPGSIPAGTSFRIANGLYLDGSPNPEVDVEVVGIEVALTVVGNEGASILSQPGMRSKENLNRYSTVFTRRINLVNGAL